MWTVQTERLTDFLNKNLLVQHQDVSAASEVEGWWLIANAPLIAHADMW